MKYVLSYSSKIFESSSRDFKVVSSDGLEVTIEELDGSKQIVKFIDDGEWSEDMGWPSILVSISVEQNGYYYSGEAYTDDVRSYYEIDESTLERENLSKKKIRDSEDLEKAKVAIKDHWKKKEERATELGMSVDELILNDDIDHINKTWESEPNLPDEGLNIILKYPNGRYLTAIIPDIPEGTDRNWLDLMINDELLGKASDLMFAGSKNGWRLGTYLGVNPIGWILPSDLKDDKFNFLERLGPWKDATSFVRHLLEIK